MAICSRCLLGCVVGKLLYIGKESTCENQLKDLKFVREKVAPFMKCEGYPIMQSFFEHVDKRILELEAAIALVELSANKHK